MAPVILFLGVLVAINIGFPIIFSQVRPGKEGQPFKIYKFRTMFVGAEGESGAKWASNNDPRRTWFGGILRKASLDELPQFFNVLRGDMSIVGPRPERPEFVVDLVKAIVVP